MFFRCKLTVTLYRCSHMRLYKLHFFLFNFTENKHSIQCTDPFYVGGQLEKPGGQIDVL